MSFPKFGMPDDLRTLTDLARFPFTTKEDLRRNHPFGMFAVPRHQVSRIHASSGTTGKPTVVGYTDDDLDVWSEVMARSIHAAGGRPGDIVHVAYGYGLFTGGLGARYGAERLRCTVVPVSGGMTPRQVQLIVDLEPRVIMVTPSYFLAILDEMEAQGVDPRSTSPEIGIFGAEPWILAVQGLTPHYLCVLTRPSRLAEVDRADLGRQLADRVKATIGTTVHVDVLPPQSLERSLGKAKRISDQR